MKEIPHSIFWKQIHNIMFMCPNDKNLSISLNISYKTFV
ncbi:hypothetical protein LEP1GSC173_1016 [Leptospira interrogans str. HAI1594]|uniref:Uncharacterized protein n=2 Tax=Leptospira interrogans TaxID=173 RepID=M6RP28_LEPIR|nr:hypothetical protein LEP1GSC117_3809 [Leptospira interrogans serovar Icterohaemorrhagiae str. Verdun LP]EKP74843.1 hypothetical protein LEP1GSC173_1016 [Leptospira interrogans str. HAI1594]EMG21695.1 hypothetical protein LEP1GSC150_0350 [Leptospira interrogans serovar Copenhageni str. LT2050]EMO07521.1 hypothetical protein LEP1GSC116_1406 [Leptospira interrogans serovar Icterohaemorrhagiae str. Verdun HP]EMO16956.1 hypothetical protein LEP1GSC167_2606 [Leptospira interrogans serovar Copenhag